jgi:hypothetical protein
MTAYRVYWSYAGSTIIDAASMEVALARLKTMPPAAIISTARAKFFNLDEVLEDGADILTPLPEESLETA